MFKKLLWLFFDKKSNEDKFEEFKKKATDEKQYFERILRLYFVNWNWLVCWNWILAIWRSWDILREKVEFWQNLKMKSIYIVVEKDWEHEREETFKLE